jgi:hypothetical protein
VVKTPPPPHDIAAERSVIGDMLQYPDTVAEASTLLTAGDFYEPANALAFDRLVSAWRRGHQLDRVSLADAMREAGHDPDPHWLADVVGSLSASWRIHAQTVVREKARRDVLELVTQAGRDVWVPGLDPFELADRLVTRLVAVHAPVAGPPADLWDLDEFIDLPEHENAPWVVDGLLRKGWRCVIVGTEGGGKSLLFRQFAVAAAQGIHPLEFRLIDKVRTLLIDLENPADAVAKSCRSLRSVVARETYEPGRAWLWHRPAGIDLRTRATRSELEAVLAACRPDLVTLGPLYKAYRRRGQESDEEATADVQEVLDDLRTRYGFALLLEHHAPQMDGHGHRKLRPYGSSLWLRWPELGIAMQPPADPADRREVELERWRGDRMSNSWPKRLEQGPQWPWVAA